MNLASLFFRPCFKLTTQKKMDILAIQTNGWQIYLKLKKKDTLHSNYYGNQFEPYIDQKQQQPSNRQHICRNESFVRMKIGALSIK